jgi:hypothetical protein
MRLNFVNLREKMEPLRKRLSSREKAAAAPASPAAQFKVMGLYALLVLLIAKFLCVPLYNSLQSKKKIYSDYVSSVTDLEKRVKTMSVGQKERKSAPASAELLEGLYPGNRNVYGIQAELLNYLTAAAEQRGLTLQSFEIPPVNKDKVISEVSVVFKQKGPTRASLDFLRDTTKLIYPPDFSKEDFSPPYSVEKLCGVITADAYKVQLKAPDNSIDRLNEYLKIPGLYDIVQSIKTGLVFSGETTGLAEKTKGYRKDVVFANLTAEEQMNIKRLNRRVLEEAYSADTPKSKAGKILDMKGLQLDRSGNDLSFSGTFSVYQVEK